MIESSPICPGLASLRHNRIHSCCFQDLSLSHRGRCANDLCSFGLECLLDRRRGHAKGEAEDGNIQFKKHPCLFFECGTGRGSLRLSNSKLLIKRRHQCQCCRNIIGSRRKLNGEQIHIEWPVSQLPHACHHLCDLRRRGISGGQRSQATGIRNRSRHLRCGCPCHGRLNDGITHVEEGREMVAVHKPLMLL